MKITDMITKDEFNLIFALYFINFSPLLLLEMNRGKQMRIQILILGFKGLKKTKELFPVLSHCCFFIIYLLNFVYSL